MIGIIGAMEAEVAALQRLLEQPEVITISGIRFIKGLLCGKAAVVARCGIGKVFAALCAESMILTFHPDCIVNTGVAGGLNPALAVGDVALATATLQHDMDTSPLGDPVGFVSGPDRILFPTDETLTRRLAAACDRCGFAHLAGPVASGDRFVAAPAEKEAIARAFDAVACEMEGGAVGQVCYVNQVPYAAVRVISDSATGEGAMEYAAFMPMAAARSSAILTALLEAEQ